MLQKRMVSETNSPRAAFITGAAKRVGRELALHLAAQGTHLAIHYRSAYAEAKALAEQCAHLGVKTHLLQADFSAAFDADALIQEAIQALGPLDLLVHNAALFEKDGLADFSPTLLAQHMAVNLSAPLSLSSAFAQQSALGDALILCLGDGTYGWSLSSKYLSYALSKIGLMELPTLLAADLAPHIRINAIGLGPTLPGAQDGPDMFDRLKAYAPLGRFGTTADVCAALDYFWAAKAVTGQSLLLSGGMHCRSDLPQRLDLK